MRNLFLLFLALHMLTVSYAQVCTTNLAPTDTAFGLYPELPLTVNCSMALGSKSVVGRRQIRVTHPTIVGDSVTVYFDAMRILEPYGIPEGITLVAGMNDSISEEYPYGIWQTFNQNLLTPAITGCISANVTGTTEQLLEAAFGGINGQGLYRVELTVYYRLEYSEPDMTSFYPNGQWYDNVTSFSPDSLVMMLQVLPDGCPSDLMAVASTVSTNDLLPNCNGSVDVNVYFGTPPFSYAYSSGQTGGFSSLDGLCNGVYEVVVTDATGNTATAPFVISTSENTIVYPAGAIDSILNPNVSVYSTDPVEWCELDYTTSIDSFGVIAAQVYGGGMLLIEPYNMALADSVLATWVIFQGGYTFETTVTYVDVDVMEFAVELTGFCLTGRAELGSFQMFTSVNLNDLVGIQEQTPQSISIHPNPTASLLRFESTTQTNYSISDLMGRTIQRGASRVGQNEITVSALPHGVYFLRLENVNAVARFVKTAE